jgi:hypothetical protein
VLQEEADRADHERILRVQAELDQAEKAKAMADKEKQVAFAVGIRQQISESEAHRRESRDKCVPGQSSRVCCSSY